MFVYVIVNDVNLKIYIGKVEREKLRSYLQQKFYNAKHDMRTSHLYAAIRKYGREHFHIYPLFESDSREEIIVREKLLIKALKAQHRDIGYNICAGGEGFTASHPRKGIPRTPEVVAKIKAARAVQDESRRVEGCRKYAEEHKDEMSTRMSREIHVMGGKAGSREAKQRAARVSVQGGSIVKAQHTRWHVNRGLTNPDCSLCPQFD
jgi:group I intron endonuclease